MSGLKPESQPIDGAFYQFKLHSHPQESPN